MVTSDPAREPALERAMPADAVPGSTIPEDTEAEILLQDGTWAWAQVTGQRKDRHGRWCVGLRWYASPAVGGREGWYLYDPGLIRRPAGPLSVLDTRDRRCLGDRAHLVFLVGLTGNSGADAGSSLRGPCARRGSGEGR